jgi:hypothetical protein
VWRASEIAKLQTGEVYKDEVKNQWDQDARGSYYVEYVAPDTLEWFWRRNVAPRSTRPDVRWSSTAMPVNILRLAAAWAPTMRNAKHGGIMYDLICRPTPVQRNFELLGLKSNSSTATARTFLIRRQV